MDPREEVRTQATTWKDEAALELPEPEVARDLLAQAFSPVVALGQGPAASTSAAARETIADLRRQLDEQEKRAKKERHEAETRAGAAAREVKAQIATMQFNIDERQRQIERLQAELERLQASLETKARALATARRIQSLEPWLLPAERVEAALETLPSDDLLARAGVALKQQALFDRASGERAKLTDHLAQLEEALAQVEAALAAAIRRHPPLVAVRDELKARCEALRDTLALPAPESPMEAQLRAQVDGVSRATLEETTALLSLAERLELVPKARLAALRSRLRQRMGDTLGETPDKDGDALAHPIERRNPALTAALRGEAPLLLFLDGHNILNGLSRYKQHRGSAVTHEDARRRLEKDLASLLRGLPLVHAHLVWDGATRSDFTISENATGHYSGGEGEHRADRAILEQLAYFRQTAGALPRVLVTDDNDFAGEAIRLGAAICRLHDFEAFMPAPYAR